ncbi:tRNA pseudouridine synthase D [Planctomycetota bacterium]|jgi:tRNA pseudouridine13 synthase|nr:tRNA pseudouridine(13) synthase TruD [Planctomycetota bacterium]MSR39200.1 tRNA pseudouridine(13) synthase TruD [Planctomycetota bacterium]GDY02355.1 tRNA pseudouridine synthase D [Planctomycetota bacterium]
MRLKTVPADFRVRELLDFPSNPTGEHYVHLLRKEKLSTPEALSMLVRALDLDRSRIAYAGLKDRQAVTDQYISIVGRACELERPGLRLKPVGRCSEPIKSRMSRGNAFTIVVRDLLPTEAAMLRRNMPSLQKTGFPNYFDDQRFGCLRHGQGFPMLQILRGEYEHALQQLVATPSPRAITGDVKLKQSLQRYWGEWETCARFARGPVYEPMFAHLNARPGDFRGAIEFLPLRQRVIHAFAYQSFLWNRAVSRLLRGGVGSAQRLRISTLGGDFLAWKYLEPDREEKLLAMETPMYGPEGGGGSEPFRNAMIAEMEYAGLRRNDFLENTVPGMIWREEPRAVLVKPEEMGDVRIAPDEMHEGRVMATLSFALPRGSYATMLLKRLFAPPFYARTEGPDGERSPRRGYVPRERLPPAPWQQRDDEDQSE